MSTANALALEGWTVVQFTNQVNVSKEKKNLTSTMLEQHASFVEPLFPSLSVWRSLANGCVRSHLAYCHRHIERIPRMRTMGRLHPETEGRDLQGRIHLQCCLCQGVCARPSVVAKERKNRNSPLQNSLCMISGQHRLVASCPSKYGSYGSSHFKNL